MRLPLLIIYHEYPQNIKRYVCKFLQSVKYIFDFWIFTFAGLQRPKSIRGNLKQSLSWRCLLINIHSDSKRYPASCRWQVHRQSQNLLPRRWWSFQTRIEKILNLFLFVYLCFNKLSIVSISSFISFLENLDILKMMDLLAFENLHLK